jgi:hypothetical protein
MSWREFRGGAENGIFIYIAIIAIFAFLTRRFGVIWELAVPIGAPLIIVSIWWVIKTVRGELRDRAHARKILAEIDSSPDEDKGA